IPIGEIVWRNGADNSLVNVIDKPGLSLVRSMLNVFVNSVPGYQALVYENSLIGTLSTDNRLVYAIEDLAIPSAPNMMQNLTQAQSELRPRVLQNVLSAFDISSGKYAWKLGKWSFDKDWSDPDNERENPFDNSHFLSVPIYVGGKLFVLNEKNYGLN